MSDKKTTPDFVEEADRSLVTTEQWIEKNFKTISYVAIAVILCVSGYFAFNHFVTVPKEARAHADLFRGEFYIQQDSFRLALDGDGAQFQGLLSIIDEAGSSAAGNLAKAYAGIAYKNLGQYEQAIEMLSGFEADDQLIAPAILGAIGDCYVELKQVEKGISYFEQAADRGENDLVAPIYLKKAGIAYESLGNYDEALEMYEVIEEEYPASVEASDIKKYIERASLKK